MKLQRYQNIHERRTYGEFMKWKGEILILVLFHPSKCCYNYHHIDRAHVYLYFGGLIYIFDVYV